MKKKKYPIHTQEEYRAYSHEGEKYNSYHFVKTKGFEQMIYELSMITGIVIKAMNENKGFRMEVNYDAEAINVEYSLYTPTCE